ncbi:MAG: nucleotide exchange factor GrpE [Cyanobacteria bacterium P01_H01_bin.121]
MIEPTNPTPVKLEHQLKQRMQAVGLSSYRQLAIAAQTSTWQVQQLRQGNITQMRLQILLQLANALQLDLATLCSWCGIQTIQSRNPTQTQPLELAAIASDHVPRSEYERLRQEVENQRDRLTLEFQRQSLYLLETWLKTWPKVVHAVHTDKPELPVLKVLALLSPLQKLLISWDVEPIGAIAEQIAFNPQEHTLIPGTAVSNAVQPGTPVEVVRPGYRHGSTLLHRADVKPSVNL